MTIKNTCRPTKTNYPTFSVYSLLIQQDFGTKSEPMYVIVPFSEKLKQMQSMANMLKDCGYNVLPMLEEVA
jgi:hypothetical protein